MCPGHRVALNIGRGIGVELRTQMSRLPHGWKMCMLFLSLWEPLGMAALVPEPKIKAHHLTNYVR